MLSFAGSLAHCRGSCSSPVELHILEHQLDRPVRIMCEGALDQFALQGLQGLVWTCSAAFLPFSYVPSLTQPRTL